MLDMRRCIRPQWQCFWQLLSQYFSFASIYHLPSFLDLRKHLSCCFIAFAGLNVHLLVVWIKFEWFFFWFQGCFCVGILALYWETTTTKVIFCWIWVAQSTVPFTIYWGTIFCVLLSKLLRGVAVPGTFMIEYGNDIVRCI